MQYICLKFIETGEVEAVPSTWVTGDLCRWPNMRDSSKISRAIKEGLTPNSNWSSHNVKVYKTFGKLISAFFLFY